MGEHDDATDPSAAGWRDQLGDAVRTWVRHDSRRAMVTAAVAFGVAWLVNVYIIAVRYEGTATVPGGAATVSGNRLTGVIFWVVLSSIVLTVVGYAQQVGWRRVGAELAVLPRNLAAAIGATDPDVRWGATLWGGAVSLFVATLFSSAAAASLGLLAIVLAASPLVSALGRAIRRLGIAVLGRVSDRASLLGSPRANAATVLGAAVGMAIAWQVGPWLPKLVLALIATAGAAMLLRSREPSPGAVTAILATFAVAGLVEALGAAAAFADDGGWREGGGSLTTWIGSSGSGRVMTQSVLGGLAGAFGAVVGSAASSVLVSASSQLAVGGLSGEFAAQEAGAAAAAPNAAVAVRGTDHERDPADDERGGGSSGDAATGDAGAGDLAMGGLSGEFTADDLDARGRSGTAPGRADQGDDDEGDDT